MRSPRLSILSFAVVSDLCHAAAGTAASAMTPPPFAIESAEIAKVADFSALPPELAPLKLDALLLQSKRQFLQHCPELVDLARERASAEPQRPGPHFVLGMCAKATGDDVQAAVELRTVSELVPGLRGLPGRWPGDIYFDCAGASDAAALMMADDGDLVAETLEIGEAGAKLFDRVWMRQPDGKIVRYRFDLSSPTERIGQYFSTLPTAQRSAWKPAT